MKGTWARLVKRALDIAVSLCVLVVLSPLIAGVALLVRWRLGSPVLFRQSRPGRDGVPFEIIKFRTMRSTTDASGRLLSDAERMTSFGKRLRSWSLDELPEFVNVLRGDMSLVVPRPLLPEYLEHYTPRQARRHEVRPGVTGLAQLNGRNLTTWQERLELDVKYVDEWSLSLDLRLLAQTISAVLTRKGITAEGHETMPLFRGDSPD
jgi:lipopolysaccharide/colanic/teichoic acid biosynthesis glycosyltransferase